MRTRILNSIVLAGTITCLPAGVEAFADNGGANTPAAGAVENVQVIGEAPVSRSLEEQQSSLSVISVLSSVEIERAPEADIADIVTRLPGLSSYADNNQGQAATGERQYVTIRGIDSSYNAYYLNGERIAQIDFNTRAVSFDTLAPYGVNSIKVNKTPGADEDGDATGGSIDIRTPTAFDFTGPLYKISVDGQLSELANHVGLPDAGGTGEVEFADRFGTAKSFGVYAAAYYGTKNVLGEATAPNSSYQPTYQAEQALSEVQATSLSTSQFKYDIYNYTITRSGADLSLDWRGDGQTLYLVSTYGRYDQEGYDNQVSIRGGSRSPGQVNNNPGGGNYNADGLYSPYGVLRGQYWETRDNTEDLVTAKIGGTTDLNRLKLDYDAFYSYGDQTSPYVQTSFYTTPVDGNVLFNQTNPFNVTAATSQTVLNHLYSLSTDKLWKSQGQVSGTRDNRYGVHADGSFDVGALDIDTIKFGGKIDSSDRYSYDHYYFHDNNNFVYNGTYFGGPNYQYYAPGGPTIAQIPGQVINGFGGFGGPIKILDTNYILNTVNPYKYVSDPNGAGVYTKTDYNGNTSYGNETIYSGYALANLKFGDVSVTPGLRYEYTDFAYNHWLSVNDVTGYFTSSGQTYGDVLPSLAVNYRPTEDSVLRGSVRETVTRPSYGQVAGTASESVDSITGLVTSIFEPNPNLKPTHATNFDLSAELYNKNQGVISINGYYKAIRDFVYTGETGDASDIGLGGGGGISQFTTSSGTTIIQPKNGGRGKLYGLEINFEQRLPTIAGWFGHADTPAFLSGFGFDGNLTLQRSSAVSGNNQTTALPHAPESIYNLGLFYERDGLRADLNYNFTGLYLLNLNGGLNFYVQPTETLDAKVAYGFSNGLSLGFGITNLLDTVRFWETEGKSTQFLAYDGATNGSYINTGRIYQVNASYKF